MARTHRAHPPKFRQQTVDRERSGRTPDKSARGYELLAPIKTIWQSNREAYGRPRTDTEPLPDGERVSPKRVGRPTRRAGIEGVGRPRSTKTTTGNERAARVAPDLVNRIAVGAETDLRKRVASQAEIAETRCRFAAPNPAHKRSRASTHEPCTSQQHAQAKRSYKRKARASAGHAVTVIA